MIEGIDADVLMLPESFEPDDGLGLIEILSGLGYTVASVPMRRLPARTSDTSHRPDHSGLWHLALASRLGLAQWRAVPIGRVPGDPAGARFAIHGEVDLDGVRLHTVALHTSSKLWYAGPQRHLFGLLRNLGPLEGPAVIGGDFNFWGPPTVSLMRGWRRAVTGRTWPAERPHSQIDHLMVNRHVRVMGHAVLANYGSDHRPVRAEIEV